MGIFFSDNPKKVSKEEFKKVRAFLAGRNMSKQEIDKVEMLFLGDLYESSDSQKGIDTKELDAKIKWLRENMSKHKLSSNDVNLIETGMRKFL